MMAIFYQLTGSFLRSGPPVELIKRDQLKARDWHSARRLGGYQARSAVIALCVLPPESAPSPRSIRIRRMTGDYSLRLLAENPRGRLSAKANRANLTANCRILVRASFRFTGPQLRRHQLPLASPLSAARHFRRPPPAPAGSEHLVARRCPDLHLLKLTHV